MIHMAVILAGGKALRLGSLAKNLPKSLIKIHGKPFIYHQLMMLKGHGVKDIVICSGYKGEMLKEYVGKMHGCGMNVKFSDDGNIPLGTGGALRNAYDMLDETFFLIYGDSYFDISLKQVALHFAKNNLDSLMVVIKNCNRWDTSNVLFRSGMVSEYNKSAPTPEMHYIDYGISILSKRVLNELPKDTPYDLATLYASLASRKKMAGYETTKRFYEIGSFAGITETEAYFSTREQQWTYKTT